MYLKNSGNEQMIATVLNSSFRSDITFKDYFKQISYLLTKPSNISPTTTNTLYLDDFKLNKEMFLIPDELKAIASGDTVTSSITIKNNTGTIQNPVLLLGIYNSVDNRLLKVASSKKPVAAINGSTIASVDLSCSLDLSDLPAGCYFKTFLWSDIIELLPLKKADNQNVPQKVVLTVKTDGTGDYVSPKLANDSIVDSSASKQYEILVYPGIYTEKNWTVKPYTTIRGTDRNTCWLMGENPPEATNSEITSQSTIWLRATANLENLKITCKNMRYPVHSEDGGNNRDAIHNIKNCDVEHYGNLEAVQYRQNWIAANPSATIPADLQPANVWGGTSGNGSHAWGFGSASGAFESFDNCTFISKATGWYVHNREDFSKPQKNVVNNSTIASTVLSIPINIQALGSGTKDECVFNDCNIIGTYMKYDDTPWITEKPENQYANHADFNVILNRCTPIGYMDTLRGRALAIFSNSTGSNSYVRVSGDAGPIILGQYTTKDGGGTLKGYIYGYWDISGIKVGLNANIDTNNTLGRRLGNCTSVNKTLRVVFEGGTEKVIVFNEDYTAQSNAYIIGKINSVLGTAGEAKEYNVSLNEYYPQVPDKQLTLTNSTEIGIQRFSAVCYDADQNSMRLMKETDPAASFVGITLESILPGQSGRVLTEGIMHKSQLKGFSGTINLDTSIAISSMDGCFEISSSKPQILKGVRTDWAYFKGNR